MYDLADWGSPVRQDWAQQRERMAARLPSSLVRVIRSRARAQGVSTQAMVQQLLSEALGVSNVPHSADPVPVTFD
jgi:predicted DNA binding CopG/RHH family protein